MIEICVVAVSFLFIGMVAGIGITLKEMRSGYYAIGGKLFRVTMREMPREQD